KMDLDTFDVIRFADTGESSDGSVFFPEYKRILFFSLFLAFWIAFTVALFFDYLDPTIKSIERAEFLLGTSILTAIPHQRSLLALLLPKSCFRGEKQAIRHILSWLKKEERVAPCVIGITASRFGEGVTRTTTLLVERLANMGEKVLYVEANATYPRVKKNFKCKPTYGLTDLFSGQASFAETAVWINPHLAVLATPVKKKEFFYLAGNLPDQLRATLPITDPFHWIILDLPPVSKDAAVVDVLGQCDAVLFQLALMKVTTRKLSNCFQQLRDQGNLLQRTIVVANKHKPFWFFS
ncbi:MAG: hypothetical protein D3923_07605, partial [Candidatus Electrothrix sp. AR3]|nr:hypothetical protein [Candidatus Electrothrix sp. AR3]